MRITNKRIRQFLLSAGDTIDPATVPDTIQLYNLDGTPFDIAAVMAANADRRTTVKTTASLAAAVDTNPVTRAAGGAESGVWHIGPGTMLTKISATRPCRVRLYTTSAKRDADVGRDRYTDPMNLNGFGSVPDHGCLSEFLLINTLTVDNIPSDYLASGAGDDAIYYRIGNYDLSAGTITVTLTVKDVEA